MPEEYKELTPYVAWNPLPHSEWNAQSASHLLRRIGFSATPDKTKEVLERGLSATIDHYFGVQRVMPIPPKISSARQNTREMSQKLMQGSPEEQKKARREIRRNFNEAYREYGLNWIQFAREDYNAPYEKMVMFLQDVLVVGLPKTRNPYWLYLHQSLLRENINSNFDTLCKAVSRSPAMIKYLDLQQNRKGHPNENFARELFELFILGEGNYTEKDIKEAARAFTGYKIRNNEFFFNRRQFDDGSKTVFNRKGRWNGDDVIDLALDQSAARTFLPNEFLHFYLSTDVTLEDSYLKSLGNIWRRNHFNLGSLIKTVFKSRIFFHPQFRGNLIKSPTHFYFGLLQDLNLDVAPFPSHTLNALRNMGQPFFAPPNVRGWVGGKNWINASTLAARRQLIESLFSPLEEDNLNADDYAALKTAHRENRGKITVTEKMIKGIAGMKNEAMVDHFINYFLSDFDNDQIRKVLMKYINQGSANRTEKIRNLVAVLLQSPQYQLS